MQKDEDIPDPPPTQELVRRARDDSESFGDLYRRFAPAVFAWANARVHGGLRRRMDPEDLLQEISIRAFERFEEYDGSRSPFRAWIFGIANNVLREALASLRSRPAEGLTGASDDEPDPLAALPDDATSVSRHVARSETMRALCLKIGELSDDERRLLIYRGFEGRSHPDTAERLKISTAAVEKRWQRLLERLDGLELPPELLAG